MTAQLNSRGAGQTAFLLAQLGGLAAQRFAERLDPLGVTPPQAGLLRAVAANPGRSQQALSAQLGLAPSRLVALVDELERTALLERRRDPQDRRYHALHLTRAGEQRLRAIGRAAHAHGQDLLACLDESDRTVLAEVLQRLADGHSLAPGVHPGYRTMGPASPAAN